MKIFLQPQQFPQKGGVATHLKQLHFHLQDKVELVSNPNDADILHVESAYPIPKINWFYPKKIVYVCHGGFVPDRLKVVDRNLEMADIIISVSQWIVDKFFPYYAHKTKVIPNGVNLKDFQFQKSEGYVLYAKEWDYYFNDAYYLSQNTQKEVWTTIWPGDQNGKPLNVKNIGLQSSESMKQIVSKAGCLLLTGSEVCPTMLLEAWAAKVPVVAKNIDGSFEIFEKHNFKGGMTYQDQKKMLDCIDLSLMRRDEMGQEGYEIVKEHYQWKDLINQYLEAYEECLN